MAIKGETYSLIEVESYIPDKRSGRYGEVHIRPVPGQAGFDPSLHVQCSKDLSTEHPVGTRFLIKGKLNDLKGGGKFIYSSYQWTYEVISMGKGPIIKG
ncbi:hypothetical protein ACPUEN_11695 [Algoriphagus yeomjeoni]|uniref:hypothetical protein n=1 Tax=Algoriphagus yeomjeoni TaxID=291403 RepID=UPI003CE454E5